MTDVPYEKSLSEVERLFFANILFKNIYLLVKRVVCNIAPASLINCSK